MRAWVRLLAVCVLLVGMLATAATVGAAEGYWYETWAQNATPSQYSNEVIWVELCYDEDCYEPASGVPVYTIWKYRTTTSYLDWHTGYDGRAAMTRNISGASCGFTVRVDIFIDYDQRQIDSAYFTPRC